MYIVPGMSSTTVAASAARSLVLVVILVIPEMVVLRTLRDTRGESGEL